MLRWRVLLVFLCVAVGLGYEGLIWSGWGALMPRFPTPYAVPIFDVPFALVAVGIGYLCLERHRLRQDGRSAGLGTTLWLTALLALSHVLAQPDYPANPGVNAGIAPYFFFLSYFAGLAGIGLAAHCGECSFPLRGRGRFALGAAVVLLSGVLTTVVLHVRPLLSPVAGGRFTPFGLGAGYFVLATAGVWALSGGLRRYAARDPFGGYFLLAAFIWILGLLGFLLHPFRYSIPWYLAGFARPLGVGVIFVGLLREQVWLYREARARQRDLDVLHRAGQALVRSLDLREIAETIATKALEVSGADGAILFRYDARDRVLSAMSRAGAISDTLVSGLALPLGQGASGVSVAERRAVFTSLLGDDPAVPFPHDVVTRVRGEGLRSVLAIPLASQTGEVYGALSVFYLRAHEFTTADVELLSAFGTQASVAIENGRSFEELARRARHDGSLQDFAQHLLQITDEDEIRSETVRVTRAALGADHVGLFLSDPADGCLRLTAGLGWQPDFVGVLTIPPSSDSFAGYTFLTKTLVQVDDIAAEHRFAVPAHLTAHGIAAGVAVPLGARDQPIGVLAIYYHAPRRLSDEQGRVLMSIAHQTALALEKARLYAELQARLGELQQTQDQLIQADKLKALGTLLSGVAHELNNPLSTILMSAQLLLTNRALPEAVRERAGAIESECGRASRIIRELLAFARQRRPERRRVDVNEIVRDALQLYGPDFALKRIRIASELGASVATISADPFQLQQVLLNLFTNAAHAMSASGRPGVLTVRTAQTDAGVTIVVEDNGPGIPAENLRRVFDPFFTTKAVGEGTGLGLSLCIGIIEAHDGHLAAENVPTSGARFTIQLPLGEEVVDVIEEPAAGGNDARDAVDILVVEDEPALRAALVQVLRMEGHRTVAAATGHAALESLARETYDVVILDLRLPDIDGKAIWQWISRHHPGLCERVVFMTGDTLSPGSNRFLQEAGRPVLAKPVAMDELTRMVDTVVGSSAGTVAGAPR